MSNKISTAAAEAALAAIKAGLDGGNAHIFSGPVPADAADALGGSHTLLATLSLDGVGGGLTFAAPTGTLLPKTPTEEWVGEVLASGTPTFFRFTEAGDNPTSAGSGSYRLQGTAGGPSSSADMRLGADSLTANGTNTVGVPIFNVRLLAFV